MMNLRLSLLFLIGSGILVFVPNQVSAQQEPQYTMYRFNGLFLNPAYAGSHDLLNVMAIYRHQWVNMPGQPQTASVALHTPLKNDRIGLGFIYTFDKIGVTNVHDMQASFAYRLPIGKNKKARLCFGISAGATNYSAKLSSIRTTDPDDPNFTSNVNLWMPNVGAGIYIYHEKYFAGISVPKILANSLSKSGDVFVTTDNIAHQYHHLLITGGYVFSFGRKVKFMPSVLLKVVPQSKAASFDFNTTFIFIDRIWLGVGYRYLDSYSFTLSAYVTKKLRVGYAYDLSVSALNQYTTGSHEVMLSYDFDLSKGKVVNPRRVKYF